MAQNYDVWATVFPLRGHQKEGAMDSPSPFGTDKGMEKVVQVSLFSATVSLFLLPSDFLNFKPPSSAEQASSSGECPQFGDMVCGFVWVQSTILQCLRCADLPIFPLSISLAL